MKAVHFRYPATPRELMWTSEPSIAITDLSPTTATGGETRLFRDGVLRSFKLSALIDQVVVGFVEILSRTGKNKPLFASPGPEEDRTLLGEGMTYGDEDLVIESPHGWHFAFEGGAHILFRHTLQNPRFVRSPHPSLELFRLTVSCRMVNSCGSQNAINTLFLY
jgi:hypothetical protein